MQCFVIMCNDSPEFVVIGDKEKAETKKSKLQSKDKAFQEKQFGKEFAYEDRYFWRAIEVNAE